MVISHVKLGQLDCPLISFPPPLLNLHILSQPIKAFHIPLTPSNHEQHKETPQLKLT